MNGTLEFVLVILLILSIILNLILLKKIRELRRELEEVGARVSVTKDELSQIRRRLEKMKGEF
jgi:predicted Holliday junction resolvase-like endonuclease